MKEPKFYVETSVGMELPRGESAIWMQPIGYNLKRFREFSLPELMEELIQSRYGAPQHKDDIKNFVNDFLTQKGII